jgi:hypothetical protein
MSVYIQTHINLCMYKGLCNVPIACITNIRSKEKSLTGCVKLTTLFSSDSTT